MNLDELISANFTADMDDETDLPDLAALDLDDSVEEFWKMGSLSGGNLDYDLDWNPTETSLTIPVVAPNTTTLRRPLLQDKKRSDSFSSENSLNSQSTITQYAKYGLTPMIHPSESSSSSSRSLSRLSNYSTASSTTPTTTGGIPTPSRSYTTRNHPNSPNSPPSLPPGSTKRITKRASHIPAPAPATSTSPPTPQRTLSSSSSTNNPPHRIPTLSKPTSSTSKRIPGQRASHIPTVRESIHRPGSPLNSGRNSATPSRIGMRSPTPGPRNSLFHDSPTHAREEQKRVMSPTANRPSGLRPPTSASSIRPPTSTIRSPTSSIRPPSTTNPSSRSVSRIGTVKKS